MKKYLSPQHPNQELAQYFLEQIHHYYPIGLPHFSTEYPGFQELLQIQKNKFSAVEREEPKTWYKLVEMIRGEFANSPVFNSAGAQFPCYEVSVSLSETKKVGLHIYSSLTLSISLLVKYYAIVLTDVYSYMGPEHSGVSHQFVSSGLQHHLELDSKIALLKNIVSVNFPEYRYTPHDVLFKYMVQGGYPYNGTYDDTGAYTIYDYHFQVVCSDNDIALLIDKNDLI